MYEYGMMGYNIGFSMFFFGLLWLVIGSFIFSIIFWYAKRLVFPKGDKKR